MACKSICGLIPKLESDLTISIWLAVWFTGDCLTTLSTFLSALQIYSANCYCSPIKPSSAVNFHVNISSYFPLPRLHRKPVFNVAANHTFSDLKFPSKTENLSSEVPALFPTYAWISHTSPCIMSKYQAALSP